MPADHSYTGLAAALHDAFWAAAGAPAELPPLAAFLRRHPGRALEVGCGSGRLLLPLLRQGHPLEGLDSSAEMLGLCREAAATLGLRPVLHLAAMESFADPRRFRALAVPAFTLQLAPDPAAALANLARLLEPGGGLYLTAFLPLAEISRELPANRWYPDHETEMPQGRRATLHTRHRIDLRSQTLHRSHRYRIIDRDGKELERHETHQTLHWFEAAQLHTLLEAADFAVVAAYGEFDRETPACDAQIFTLEATLRSPIPPRSLSSSPRRV